MIDRNQHHSEKQRSKQKAEKIWGERERVKDDNKEIWVKVKFSKIAHPNGILKYKKLGHKSSQKETIVKQKNSSEQQLKKRLKEISKQM